MSLVGYFKIDGVDGSCAEKGSEKFTYCYNSELNFAYEVDPVHHRLTGEIKIPPFEFLLKLEETYPEWLKLFRQGKECKAKYLLTTRTKGGTMVPYVQYEFSNCLISGLSLTQAPMDPKEGTMAHLVKLALVCRKLTITHDKYDETDKVSHRKTQDTYDFDNPTA